jgi:hypothetical protein
VSRCLSRFHAAVPRAMRSASEGRFAIGTPLGFWSEA